MPARGFGLADSERHLNRYLLDLFNLADTGGDGSVTMDELLPFLASKGIHLAQASAAAALRPERKQRIAAHAHHLPCTGRAGERSAHD